MVVKVFKSVVAEVVCRHLMDNKLLSNQQLEFGLGRFTADLLMLLTKSWKNPLNDDLDTVVIALDTTDSFDRV